MVAAVVAVVLAIGAGGWWLVGRPGAGDTAGLLTDAGPGGLSDMSSGNVSTTAGGTDGPLGYNEDQTEADAAIAIVESAATDPAGAIAAESIEAAGGTEGLLPDGAVITVAPDSWRRTGDVAEVVADVSLPDGTVDRFVVLMVRGDQGWRIAYTVRGEAP